MSLDSRRSPHMRPARIACTIGLAGVIALGGAASVPTLSPAAAHAATPSTRAELKRLQSRVSSAAATYAEATAKADELNAQVAAIADEIIHIEQELLPARQKRAAEAASDLYKTHSSNGGAISLLLNAGSFADFINLTKYLGTVQTANISALNELNDLEDQLNGKLDELGRAKDQADAELSRAAQALGDAQGAAAQIQAKANAEDAAEAEIARQAAEQAAQLQAQQNASQGNGGAAQTPPEGGSQNAGDSNQGQHGGSAGGDSHVGGATSGNGNASGNAGGGTSSGTGGGNSNNDGGGDTTGSWKTGVASYYGIGDGFMGGTTANGEKVTETSMGIAMLNVPFGTRVEIRYGGRSVIAYVNDRGPYAHGRVIDMQPAVARALNFLNVGVGTVQYRFL